MRLACIMQPDALGMHHAKLAGGIRLTICSARKCSVVHCATSPSFLAAMLSLSPDFGAAQDRDHLLTEQGDRLGAAPIHRAPKDLQKVAGPQPRHCSMICSVT